MTVHGFYIHSLFIEESAKPSNPTAPLDLAPPSPTISPLVQSSGSFSVFLSHRFTGTLPSEEKITRKIVERVSLAHYNANFYSQFHSQKNSEGGNDARMAMGDASGRDSHRKMKNRKFNGEGYFSFDSSFEFSTDPNEELDLLISDQEESRGDAAPLTVIWKQVSQNLFYSLLCDESENLLNASRFLHSFPKTLAEHFGKLDVTNNPNEILMRVDDVIVLLNSYLPNGLLLFGNSGVDKNLKKEASSLLVL